MRVDAAVGRLSQSLRPLGCPANDDEGADCALNRTLNLNAWANQAAALEFIVRCHAVDGVVLFTTVYARHDTPQVDEWLPNWLAGVRKAFPSEFSAKRLIVGVDEESCAAIAAVGVQGCVVDGSRWWRRREQIAAASAPFHMATSLKFLYAHAILRVGYAALFADIDVAWTGKGDVLEYLMGPKRRIAGVPDGDAAAAAEQARVPVVAQAAVAVNTTNSTLPSPSPLPLRGNAYVIDVNGLPDIQQFSDYIGCPQPHVSRTAAGSHDWREALFDVDAYRNPCTLELDYKKMDGSFACLSTGLFLMQPSDRMNAFMDDLMRMMTDSLQWEQAMYNHAVWKYVAGTTEGAVPPHKALSLVMLDARVIGNAEEAGCSMQISDGGLDWRMPKPLPGAPLHVATVAKPPPAPPQLAMHMGFVAAHSSKIFLAQQAGYWHVDIRARSANMLLRQRSVPLERLKAAAKESTASTAPSTAYSDTGSSSTAGNVAACVYLIVGGNSDGRALAVPDSSPPDSLEPLVGKGPLIQPFPLDDAAIDAAAAAATNATSDKATRLATAAAPPLPADGGSCLSHGPWARFAWEVLPAPAPLATGSAAGSAQSQRGDGPCVILAHRLPSPSPLPAPTPSLPPAQSPAPGPPGPVGGPGNRLSYGAASPSGNQPADISAGGFGPGLPIGYSGAGPAAGVAADVSTAHGGSLRGSSGGGGGSALPSDADPIADTAKLEPLVLPAAPLPAPPAAPPVKRVYISRIGDGNGLRLVGTPEEALPFELQPCEVRFDGYIGFQLPVELQPPDLRLQLFGDIEAASLRAVHPGALDSAPQHKAQACWLPVT